MTATTRSAECSAPGAPLMLAVELGSTKWVLGFTTAPAQRPRLRRIAAGDLTGLEKEIQLANGQGRSGPADARQVREVLPRVTPDDQRNTCRALAFAERAVDTERRARYARLATLAAAHKVLGQPERAMVVLREALALPEEIQSWSTETQFVDLLREHGTPDELERWLLDRLEQFKRLRGPDDRSMARTLRHLAQLYARQGRAQDAEARWRDRVAQLLKTAPETNWQVAQARTELGEQLVKRGAFAEAEPLLLRGMADLRADSYVGKRELEEARTRIVQLYAASKRPAEAEAWRQRALR